MSAELPVHITKLEMAAPPKASLPVPVNIQTAIMRAPEIPLPFYRYLYRQVGARWHWVDRLRMEDDALAATVHAPQNTVTVLYVNGAPAGFFELLKIEDDIVELTHFGLIEHALGLGIGDYAGKAFRIAHDQALYIPLHQQPVAWAMSTKVDMPQFADEYVRPWFAKVNK